MFALSRPAARLLAALCLLIGILFVWYWLPLADWLTRLVELLRAYGEAALLIYALVYIIATIIMVPLAPLAIAAGYLFGLGPSFGVSLIAATTGATLAFLLSRHLLARTCERWLLVHPVMAATERSIAEQGWLVVFLLRLSPVIPSHLLNYLCGITHITARQYISATLIGKIPLIFMLSYVGALATRTAQQVDTINYMHLSVLVVGLLFTALACWLIARRARQLLKRQGIADD